MFEKLLNAKQTLSGKQEKNLKIIVAVICLITIAAAIATCLYMFYIDRSLWGDEALLAYSLSQRSLGNLTSEILDYIQSAPVIYLYIVKIITLVFGDSELTLRLFAFISYLAAIGLSYVVADRLLHIKYPIIPTALIASLTIMIQYSNEFKPYMTDAMSVLIILMIYYLYSQGKIKNYILIAAFAILIWLSNPVCFFIAAILLYEFVEGIREKRQAQIKFSIICGVIVFISFIVYYFYWLKLVVDAGDMSELWEVKRFPLIPTSVYHLFQIKVIFQQLVEHFGDFRNIILFFVFAGVPLNIFWIKNKYINIINLALFITLFASWLGMFPIHDRMCLFIYPIFVLLFFFYLSQLYTKQVVPHLLLLIASFVVLFSARGIETFTNKDNIHFSEINWAVDFIEDRIGENDILVLQDYLLCEFAYGKKYNLKDQKYRIIEVGSYWSEDMIVKDAERVKKEAQKSKSNIYFLTNRDAESFSIKPIIDTLRQYGDVELIYNAHSGVHSKNVFFYKNGMPNKEQE